MLGQKSKELIQNAVKTAAFELQQGGVIAYPTEYCFGLGCDPKNHDAVIRLLKIKQRKPDQGLILVASSIQQIELYVDLYSSPLIDDIKKSWPGHVTWLLASRAKTPNLISGKHSSIAIRQTEHTVVKQLCDSFGGAIVSTSANRHAQAELMTTEQVIQEFGSDVDYVLDGLVGKEVKPSNIRDGISGATIR